MIKGLKKLQAALFAVAVLLMFALVFTFVYGAGSGNEILPVAEASAETYEHGTLTTQRPQNATSVSSSNVSEFSNLISSNTNISLTSDITLPYFLNTSSYSGTIYGNGHTITVSVPDVSGANSVTSMSRTVGNMSSYVAGGVIGELTGKIYDCKFVLGRGDYKIGAANVDPSHFVFGGIIGYINGGTVSNVQVEVLTGTDFRVFCWRSADRAYLGILTGAAAANATVTNVTIVNNGGTFRAGYASDTSVSSIYTDCQISISSNLIGYIEGANTIDNIIVKGGTTDTVLSAKYAANIGAGYDNNLANMTNFYNAFGVLNASGAAEGRLEGSTTSALIFASTKGESGASQLKVQNYYEYYNSDQDSTANDKVSGVGTAPLNSGQAVNKISIAATVGIGAEQGARDISFDPTTPTYAQSLVVIYTGQAKAGSGMTRTWLLTPNTDTGAAVTASAVIEGTDTDTVVFRRLPSGYSSWGDSRWGANDGIFTASLTAQDSEAKPPSYPTLTQYEHGYVGSQTTTGTPISSASDFSAAFSPSGNATDGSYYLTRDIVISGFSGHDFSGTLDGNGHTIFIDGLYQQSYTGQYVGGLFGTLSGTVKNVRVVLLNSVTVNSAYENNIGVGLIAGRLNGGTVENVNAVISKGATLSTTVQSKTTALGAVAGVMEGSGTLTNVTVQLDGILDVNGSWSFVAGFVGRSMKPDSNSAPIYNFSNIIIKGEGRFSGTATGDSAEPKYVGVVTVLQGSTGTAQVDINGLIYNLTTNWNNNNDNNATTPVEGTYASYGWVAQNLYNAGGTQAAVSAEGYVNYANIFEVEGAAFEQYMNAGSPGNTYIQYVSDKGLAGTANARRTALISNSISGVTATHTVTPYFVPNGADTSSVTLVAHSSDWLGTGRLQTNGNGTGDYRAEGNYKIVTVAKENAYDSVGGTITLSEYVAATLTVTYTSVKYSGSEANFGISVSIGGNILDSSNYTILYEGDEDTTYAQSATAPANVGNYIITVTLTNGDMFEGNGGNLTSSKQSFVTIIRADLPNTVTVSINGWTYGHYSADTNAPSVSFPEGFGAADVTYVYYSSNSDDAVIDNFDPAAANAGTYYVAAQIAQTANYNDGTTARVSFTINKADLPTDSIKVTMGDWTYGTPADPVLDDDNGYTDGAERTYLYTGTSANGTKYDSAYKPTDAGTYTVTVTFGESTNYLGGSVTSAEFTISPKELTFTATLEVDAKITYGDVLNADALKNLVKIECSDTPAYDHDYTVTVEATGYSEDTPADTEIALTVTVSFDESIAANYSVTQPEASALKLTVQKKELTLSVKEGEKTNVYGAVTDYDAHFAGLFSLDGVVGSDDFASLFDVAAEGQGVATLPDAGTYTVTAELKAEAKVNYTLADDSVNSYTYTITQREVTGTWSAEGGAYTGQAHTPTFTATEGDVLVNDNLNITYSYDSRPMINAGTYDVTATLDNDNYVFASGYGSTKYTISPAQITWSWSLGDGNIVFGDLPEIVKALVSVDTAALQALLGDEYETLVSIEITLGGYTDTTDAHTEVTFDVTLTLDESMRSNIELTPNDPAVTSKTVQARDISSEVSGEAVADIFGSTLGATDSEALAAYFADNFKFGEGTLKDVDGVAYSIQGADGAVIPNAGTYTVTATFSGNYAGSATLTYTINPAEVSLAQESLSFTFGELTNGNYQDAGQYAGLVNGYNGEYTVSVAEAAFAADKYLAADTYTLTVRLADGNYTFAEGDSATLSLVVNALTVTAVGSVDKVFGDITSENALTNGTYGTLVTGFLEDYAGNWSVTAHSWNEANYSDNILDAYDGYTVTVTLSDTNYTLADGNTATVTVNVAPLTINATLTASGTAVQDGAIDITGSDKITFDTDTNGVLVIMLGGEEVARVTVTFAADDGTQYTPDGIAFAIAHVDFGTGIEAGTGVTRRSVTVSFSDTNFALGETLGGVTFEVSGNISVADGITSTVTYEPGTSYDTDYFKDNKYFVTSNPDDVANITVTIYRGENASGEEIGEGIISDAGTYYVQGAIDGAAAGFKFTIAKADNAWTVEFNREGWTYGSQAGAYTAPQAASGEPEITYYKLTADGGREPYEGVFDNTTGAGTYVAVVTVAESTNYNVLTKEYQFVVAKADNSLTTGFSAGWTYGEEPVISEPSAAFGEVTVTYYTDAERQHAVDREFFTSTTDAATYYVTVCVAESENYNEFSADFSFAVEKAGNSLTTEFTAGWTYGEEPVISEPSAAFGDVTVTYYADEEHLEQLDRGFFTSATNAGTYYCVITVEGTDNYDGISEERSFEIKKASVAVDFDIENTVYNGEEIGDPVLKEGSNPGGAAVTVTFTADSGSLNANDRPRNAGSYTVTVAVAESTNYLGGEASKSFEITRKEVTVTVENADSLVYTGEPIELALAADGIVAADTGAVIPVATAAEGAVRDAKEYHLTFSLDGEGSGNYVLTQEEGVVTVHAAQTTVSVADANGVYDGAAYDGSITVALGNAGLSLGEITWQYRVGDGGWTEGLPVNAGTYTISIKTYSNSGNVTVTNLGDATAQLVIDKAQVRYTATLAEGAEIVFGDTFTQEQMNALVTVTDDGGVTVDTYTVRLELADGSAYDASVPVGTAVSIVIVPVVDEANYEVTVTEGLTLSVQSKAIDIVLDTDGNGETDEDKISSGATVTIQQGESLALAAAVEAFLEEQGIPAGSYRILIDGAEFAGTENLAARTYRMQVSLTGGYQGVLEFMLTVEGDDEPVAPPVDPDEPDDPDPDEPVDPDPEEPVDPDEPGTPDEPEQPAQPDGEGFPGWAIAVIVCGGLLVIAAVTGIAVAAARKRKKSGDKK